MISKNQGLRGTLISFEYQHVCIMFSKQTKGEHNTHNCITRKIIVIRFGQYSWWNKWGKLLQMWKIFVKFMECFKHNAGNFSKDKLRLKKSYNDG